MNKRQSGIPQAVIFFLMLSITSFIGQSCDGLFTHDPPETIYELPPITTTGEVSFGCYVNGKLWLFGGRPMMSPLLNASYYQGVMAMTATRKEKEIEENDPWAKLSSIGFSLKYPNRQQLEGEYLLTKENRDFDRKSGGYGRIAAYSDNFPDDCWEFYTDSLVTGKLTILKHDTVARLVAGTFDFEAINENPDGCKDTIKVTDGRFDFYY